MVQELLRHSSSKMTLDVYAQALTPAKRATQRKVVAMIREDLSVPRSVAKMFVVLDGHMPAIASTPKTTMRFIPYLIVVPGPRIALERSRRSEMGSR